MANHERFKRAAVSRGDPRKQLPPRIGDGRRLAPHFGS
jgi:hypothetical protein